MVPVGRNMKFAGREDDLAKLEEILFSNHNDFSKAAVYGLGGIGKTQVVLELAYRTRDTIPDCSIFWIPALTADTFRQAYREIGRQLKIPGMDSPDCAIEERVKDYLSAQYQGRWLLAVDNADDTELWSKRVARAKGDGLKCLINYLPRSSTGSIVLTTRNRSIAIDFSAMPGATIEVLKMNEDVAMKLFRKSVKSESAAEEENVRVLLEELAYLPLAISQAASYLTETGTPISDYLEILRGQEVDKIELLGKDFEDEGRYDADLDPNGSRNAIATTWLISFEHIQHQNQMAVDYLAFMAFMEPKDIPLSLLPAAESRIKFQDAIGILDSYGFVTRRTGSQALDMHRLIHLATRNWLRERNVFHLKWVMALKWVAEGFDGVRYDDLPLLRTYMPHANRLLQELVEIGHDETALAVRECKMSVLWQMGVYLDSEEQFAESRGKYVEAIQESKLVFGERDRQTLSLTRNLAAGAVDQGRVTEGERLWRQLLQVSTNEFGDNDRDTLLCLHGLGDCLRRQGRYNEAEDLLRKALQLGGVSSVVGSDEFTLSQDWQADIVIALADLAERRGELDEAEKLQRQAIAFYRCSPEFRTPHSKIMAEESSLAIYLGLQGQAEQSENLLMAVLNKQRSLLGALHPDTLNSISRLATIKYAQGLFGQSEVLLRDAINAAKINRSGNPANLLIHQHQLALSIYQQGPSRMDESISIMRDVLARREKLLGENHPDTLYSRKTLAWFLKDREDSLSPTPSSS